MNAMLPSFLISHGRILENVISAAAPELVEKSLKRARTMGSISPSRQCVAQYSCTGQLPTDWKPPAFHHEGSGVDP